MKCRQQKQILLVVDTRRDKDTLRYLTAIKIYLLLITVG